jgi:hypothetical protein
MNASSEGQGMVLRILRLLGVLWLLLAAGVFVFYVVRYLSDNLDSRSLAIVFVYSLIGAIAGLFLVGRIPGRLVIAIAASLVYGVREFAYLFHTLPVPINLDSIRGFVILLFAVITIVLVIIERREAIRGENTGDRPRY